MFAVNGPSGPTSRHERRIKSNRQRESDEDTRRRWAEKKREHFFAEKQHDSYKRDSEKVKKHPSKPGIFKGCRIMFNGRTGKVSSYYLAKLIQEHGGNVASAMTATRITHMVGSNLNGSKVDKVLKSSGRFKFVSSEWILQSVKLNKRLPEFDFLVYKNSKAAGALRATLSQAQSARPDEVNTNNGRAHDGAVRKTTAHNNTRL